MVKDAEKFAEEDKVRREAAEAKNQAESLVHSTDQQLKEHGDKVDASLKGEIEAAIAEARTAIEGGDAEAMKAKTEALAQVAMKLGQAIYEKTQAAPEAEAAQSAEATAEAAPGEEEVVDAEFSEVDEDKKA
jgi:molecular chaperone DnaK